MSLQRNARRLRAKAKRDMFVRRGLVAARIFRFPAPTPNVQKERLVLIDRFIRICDDNTVDPVKAFGVLVGHRHEFTGKSPSTDWYDQYCAHLLAEKEMREDMSKDRLHRRWYKQKEWDAVIERVSAKKAERVAMELENTEDLPK